MILGFDTATAATAACVLRDDGEAYEAVPPFERLFEPPGHARELMPALAELMERAGVGFRELGAIAVGVGPGTFTGLRIGLATARGLALAHGLQLRPVSSLAALAAGIGADAAAQADGLPVREGRDGPAATSAVLALIDAKRGEVFAALYERGVQRWAPFAAAPEDVAARVRAAGLAPRAVGDGSVRFRELLEAAGVRVEPDGSPAHVVRGLQICRLGTEVAGLPAATVLPEYVRVPDAKPAA